MVKSVKANRKNPRAATYTYQTIKDKNGCVIKTIKHYSWRYLRRMTAHIDGLKAMHPGLEQTVDKNPNTALEMAPTAPAEA